jgi:hypothetical protein
MVSASVWVSLEWPGEFADHETLLCAADKEM